MPAALPLTADEASAIALFFEGDRAMYEDYKALCTAQFFQDIKAGDQAHGSADVAGLGRLGHSLKTVLRSLGYPLAGDLAAAIEQLAAQGEGPSVLARWASLREALVSMTTAGSID